MNHFNPILNKYNTVKKKLKAKVTERKELNVQKDKTSILNPIQHIKLNQQLTTVTEEIEELKSRKEQLKGTFGKYYDYHRRDIAANEVDYLNVEDPDVFSHRAWELEYQRKQEMRQNQPVRSKKMSHHMEL